MISQWATKRVCKFAMKHLLGRILRNELDLEQLDVQIGSGTIHLKELALNTTYFNDQLGDTSPVVLKEGLVGSVTAKNLWSIFSRDQPCEVQIHGLELVLGPRLRPVRTDVGKEGRNSGSASLVKNDVDVLGGMESSEAAYMDIEVGVRAIAQIVEKVLLGLCVKVTNLTIKYEHQQQQETLSTRESSKSASDTKLPSTLVIRSGYVEYGNENSQSQDRGTDTPMVVKNVKFRGFTVGLLPTPENVESKERMTNRYMAERMVPVLGGADGGGILGSIQLRIPLREGSLDIPKINTEFLVQPFKVYASIWRIEQMLTLVHSVSSSKRAMEETGRIVEKRGERLERLADMLVTRSVGGAEGSVSGSSVFLPATNLISDWMRWGGADSQKIPEVAEADLAASVDEFFECLDTGSMLLATDAWKQVEYGVKARFVSVSVEVAYTDSLKSTDITVDEQLRLCLEGTVLSFAMSEKKTDLSLTVESVELWEDDATDETAASPLLNEKDGTRRTVSSLIEETLPLRDVSLYPASNLTNTIKGANAKIKERNQMLRIISSTINQSVQVGLKFCRHGTNNTGGAEGSWSLDINTNFQPVVLWLDFQCVQRVTHFLGKISAFDRGQETSRNQSDSPVSGSTSVHITSSFSSVRIISGIPLRPPASSSEAPKAFCVLDLASASMDLQLMGSVTTLGDSLVFAVEDATVFLVSKEVDSQSEKFQANDVLRIKHQGEVDASVEVTWNKGVETGPWIAKQAWDVAVAQKRRGDGGGGIGGCNFDFVAAISAEAAEEADLHLREKLIKSSSIVVQVRLPFVGVHTSRSHYMLLIELCSSLANKSDCASEENLVGSNLFSTPPSALAGGGLQGSQTAVIVQCDRLDAMLDFNLPAEEMVDEVKHWEILHFDIHKLQVLSILQMGGSLDASYLRIRHEECQVSGSPPDRWLSPLQGDTDEILLFSCRNNALQRGNGGGGNVLAVGSAGIIVTYVSWPGRERLADDFIMANVKGCTIVAYGGRLDWTNAVAAFFDPSEALTSEAKNKDSEQAQPSPVSKNKLRKYFLVDLHDAALGYEPGLEALSAPEASAVACVLAAAAVRISSGDGVHFDQEQYDVRLRDVAVHVLDLEFKKQAQFTYSTDSMQHTGFVQVAKETSVGVIVRLGGDDSQKWEIECGNNEICFDTCHDTTAACERLVAQLQQLFAPPLQQQSVQIKMHKVEVKAADVSEPPDLLDGVLENAFISLRELQSEGLDLESSELSTRDLQEDMFIEDYLSEHTPGGLSEHSDDSSSTANGPFKNPPRLGSSGGGWYEGDGPSIVEDHVPSEKPLVKPCLPKRYPKSVGRMVLQNMSVKWRLHEGSDWPFGDEDPDWNLQAPVGDSGRKPSVCLELFLCGVNVQYDIFPTTELYASKLTVTVSNFGVLDCSPNAPWKTVVGYHHVASRPRETSSQAVKIDMDAVRPDPTDVLEEYRVSFALLPIRIHLDQRHLDFCSKFFSSQLSASQGSLSEENLNLSRASSFSSNPSVGSNLTDSPTEPLLPFFQMFEVLPFNIRVDYLPRRVDLAALKAGNYAELVNLVQWKGIELQLKHVKAAGVHGLSSFSRIFLNEWLQDILQNQLFKFVQGAGPIRPLYAVGSGAAKLVVSPAQHYWKQHHLLLEMRKSFKRVSSMYKREKRDPKQT